MEGISEFKGDSSLTRDESGSWVNYVAVVSFSFNYAQGVVYEFITRFDKKEVGFDMAIASDVPIGSGLSSSAALEVSVSVFLEQILTLAKTLSGAGEDEEPLLEALCQAAEHNFPRMPCGVMDQFISSCAVKGSLLLIDCRANKASWCRWTTRRCRSSCATATRSTS